MDHEHTPDVSAPVFPDWLLNLVEAVRTIPGCLGVQTCTSSEGKLVVFTWFSSKASAREWYFSTAHREIIKRFFPDVTLSQPLKFVGEESGPIMVIASFLPAKPGLGSVSRRDEALKEGEHFPFDQAAIELYQPVRGGPSFGGTFAPLGLQIADPNAKPAVKIENDRKR